MTTGSAPLVAAILSNLGLVAGLASSVMSLVNSRIELRKFRLESARTGRDPTHMNRLALILAEELAATRTELKRHKMG